MRAARLDQRDGNAERIERGYLGPPLRVTPLAPDLAEAILDGRQPQGMTPRVLTGPFPLEWEQVRLLRS